MSHTDSEDHQQFFMLPLKELMQAPSLQHSHIPPAQVREGEGIQATSNLPRYTHSTTKHDTVLLPLFRKVVALSTSPDGKENEWRRKLKKNDMDATEEY